MVAVSILPLRQNHAAEIVGIDRIAEINCQSLRAGKAEGVVCSIGKAVVCDRMQNFYENLNIMIEPKKAKHWISAGLRPPLYIN